MIRTIPHSGPYTVVVSDKTQGQIVQHGAAIIDGHVHRVTRDRSVGESWTVRETLPGRATAQRCCELANS